MDRNEILQELNTIVRKVFENPSIIVTETTTANDIDEWDSLNHATLISAIEKHFSIKFKLTELMGFKNVGKICDSIAQRTIK
jgi:acyl carrier protein